MPLYKNNECRTQVNYHQNHIYLNVTLLNSPHPDDKKFPDIFVNTMKIFTAHCM